MSRFNVAKTTKTVNRAGGEGYSESPKLELASLVMTSFLKDAYYEKSDDRLKRLKMLIESVDPKWTAKLAIHARKVFGMRSITHVIASELSADAAGTDWGRVFYKNICHRADDVTEIIAYHYSQGRELTHAMKKGFSDYLVTLDDYKLGKYRGTGKKVKMTDAIALCRPKPTDSIKKLMEGSLQPPETWEVELSKAGADKAEVWRKLLAEDKIGHFALLRNLKNIAAQSNDGTLKIALERLVEPEHVKKSLVMPFRYLTAYNRLAQEGGMGKVLSAVSRAADVSCSNVPNFDGKTLVILDVSGSMGDVSDPDSPIFKGSVLAASLVKSNDADVIQFGETAKYMSVNTDDSLLSIAKSLSKNRVGHSTNFPEAFKIITGKYERIIVLSDMQGWVGYYSPVNEFNTYCARENCRPKIYSFDLTGYGTLEFPEQGVTCVAGWSDRVFEMMSALEDGNGMVQAIDKTEL